jgi:DNA-binding CsgD family transcriptional regulator
MDSQRAKNFVTETVAIHPEMPWLDIHGRALPDDVLKIESKSWSEKTWAEYLKTIETPMSESLISNFIHQLDQQTESLFDRAQIRTDLLLVEHVRRGLNSLTAKQRSIVRMVFWENKSEREIASEFRTSRSTVKVQKKRSLLKLSKAITLDLPKEAPQNSESQKKNLKLEHGPWSWRNFVRSRPV